MNEFERTQKHIWGFSDSDFRIQILAIQLHQRIVVLNLSVGPLVCEWLPLHMSGWL